ncbi:polyprenyl synthetase family protein [Halanaerobaculum tunisiense]
MKIKEFLETKRQLIDQALDNYLPVEDDKPTKLHQAMRYSVLAGGKRLRPILTLVAAKLVGGSDDDVLPAACAIELVHNYSLIHDDLPCMDDDDYRRGQPTNHQVFGTGLAVLAGDSLLTLAFEMMAQLEHLPNDRVLQATNELAVAAGNQGMVGGQVADIEAETKQISKQELDYIHRHKTGALLKSAVRIGGVLAGANQEELAAFSTYAQNLGLAFQIVDDILDIEGDVATLGKDVGSDLDRQKATFPALYGLEEAKERAQELCQEAKEAVCIFGPEAEILLSLADYIIDRDH